MTKSLLIVAAALLCASPAWAIDAPSPQGSGNSVNGALATPAQPAAPAPTYPPSSTPDTDTYHAMAPESFNPAAYRTTTDCLNAAEAAHAQLGQCERH
jgi:hypothetical protein